MQVNSNIETLSKQRNDIIFKYNAGPSRSQVDDWENPQYSIYFTTDYYGFIHDGGISEDFQLKESKIKKLDCKRETKWRKLIKKKTSPRQSQTSYISNSENPFSSIVLRMNDNIFREEITKRVYKGIPQQFKASIWHVFLDISKIKNKKSKVYDMMLKKALDRSPDVHQIDLDVNRTFRNTTYFRERYNDRQKALLHVLSAYSMYNTEIGYCQGMSEIGGLLLMYLVEEEDVFWGLSQLMTAPKWSMHGMFVAGFPRLLTFFAHLNLILQKLLPKIAKHFDKLELLSSSYALKWFMQCFLDRVPFTLFLRLWDIYLLEGEKLLIAMAYNILKMHKKRIIKMDHCSILQFIQCDLRKDFLYEDDFVVESLKACIEELRKLKLSVPPPTQNYELPSRPFGTDNDFLTPSLSAVKERQAAQANPEEVIRRSIKKRNSIETAPNSYIRKPTSRPDSEEKYIVAKSVSREPSQTNKDMKSDIEATIPSQIRYRISNKHHSINKSNSLHLADAIKISHLPDNSAHVIKIKYHSKNADRKFIKSVPDLSNTNTDVPVPRKLVNNIHFNNHKMTEPESRNKNSNHVLSVPVTDARAITKSKTMSSIQPMIPMTVKRRPLSSSPETMI